MICVLVIDMCVCRTVHPKESVVYIPPFSLLRNSHNPIPKV